MALPFTDLAYEENSLGRFLKENGKADRTKAGKMMVAVGKTMSYSGQQRLAIRVPLVRLYQARNQHIRYSVDFDSRALLCPKYRVTHL